MDTNFFFSRDSEAALGSQSGTMGGLFWSRIRLGKAVAGPGVRGQSATVGGLFWTRFGPELDWEKLWRDQVFGAKMTETNGHKLLFF